jgi:hypothetical protein
MSPESQGAQGQFETPGLLKIAICRREIYRPRSSAASPSSLSGRFCQNWNNQFEPFETAWLPDGLARLTDLLQGQARNTPKKLMLTGGVVFVGNTAVHFQPTETFRLLTAEVK